MKRSSLIFLLFAYLGSVSAQCVYDWGTSIALSRSERALVKDHLGNIISVSRYGFYDLIVKRNSSGTVLFSKTFYADNDQLTWDCYVDNNNNIYLTGAHMGSIHFGSVTLSNIYDICSQLFVIKIDPFGNLLWMKQSSGNTNGSSLDGDESGLSVTADSIGNCYISGYYSNGFIFDTFDLTGTGSGNFMAKLDAATGTVLWIKVNDPFSNTNNLNNTEACKNGDYYHASNFIDNIYIDTATLVLADRPFENNIYIAMYDTNGSLKWYISSKGQGLIQSTTIDIHQNIIITGFMTDSLAFGSDKIYSMTEKSVFVVKVDTLGNVIVLERLIVSPNVTDDLRVARFGIDTDSQDNLYLSGTMGNELNFNGLVTSDVVLSANHSYAVKFDNTLTPVWYNTFGTSTNEYSDLNIGIIKLENKNAYTSGYLVDNLIIDSTNFNVGDFDFHSYYAELCDLNGSFIDPTTGVNELLAKNISVYPNPASCCLNIKNIPEDKFERVEIYNSSGMLIYFTNIPVEYIKLGNLQFPNGLYLLKIQYENAASTVIKFTVIH